MYIPTFHCLYRFRICIPQNTWKKLQKVENTEIAPLRPLAEILHSSLPVRLIEKYWDFACWVPWNHQYTGEKGNFKGLNMCPVSPYGNVANSFKLVDPPYNFSTTWGQSWCAPKANELIWRDSLIWETKQESIFPYILLPESNLWLLKRMLLLATSNR